MNKNKILETIKQLKENRKRNFTQSYDLIFVYEKLNIKNPEQQLDFYQSLQYENGKKTNVCALVDTELAESAKAVCKTVILVDEFEKFAKDKKAVAKLADEHNYFIAQANVMAKVAQAFGRVLGPKGKMPNPKAGCVIPQNANMKALVEKLEKTVRVSAKSSPMSQINVGKEDMPDEDVADNIMAVYEGVVQHLPTGINNLKKVMLKLTMSKPIKLE